MILRFPSFAPLRIWSLLLLAVIGLQAAAPIRAPLDRPPGSAFSATTVDVAVSTVRRDAKQAAPAQITPDLPRHAVDALPLGQVPHLLPSPRLRPEPRGPPPRAHPARLPDSTAPPLA